MGSDQANSSIGRGVSSRAGTLLALGCVALFAASLWGCEASEFIPSRADYDFTTSCQGESELETCSTCCDSLSFDTALVALGDCGCAYTYQDWFICEEADGDIDTCFDCCRSTDDDSAANVRNGECRCVGIQRTEPEASRRSNRCDNNGDSCICSRETTGTCGPTGMPGDDSIVCVCSM